MTLVGTLLTNLAFVLVALSLGEATLPLLARLAGRPELRPESPSLLRFGSALLSGFGLCALIGLVLGLLRVWDTWTFAACGVVAVAVTRRRLAGYARALAGLQVGRPTVSGLVALVLVVATALLLAPRYWAALAPPTARDSIAYHLPEAGSIADSGAIGLRIGENDFYGNLPKLVETLFAEGIELQGIPLAQALHVSVFAAFLIFVFAVSARLFGRLAGALSCLLLVLHEELAWNASTAYIDAATSSFEVGSVLSVSLWLQERDDRLLALAALLAGIALSAKYSAGGSLIFTAVVLAIALVRTRPLAAGARLLGRLGLVVFFVAGFWYVKNSIRFGNPTYPLYFGHPGFDEVEYRSLISAIQEFGPRTLDEFVRFPTRFADWHTFPATVALYAAPLGVLIRRVRVAAAALAAYVLLYSGYWFFLATHQTRFVIPAIVVALILLAALVAGPTPLALRGGVTLAGVTAAVAVLGAGGPGDAWRGAVSSARARLAPEQLRYVTGAVTADEYLAGEFGCQYEVIVLTRAFNGQVIDNWTVWHDANLFFYADGRFVPLQARRGEPVQQEVRRRDLRYVYFRTGTKGRFFANPDEAVARYRRPRAGRERWLLLRSTLVWSQDDCRLYRIGRSADSVGAWTAGRP